MSDGSPLFRPEALEHRARAQTEGDVVRWGPRWTGWAFWLLLALVVVAVVAGSTIRIPRYAGGPTIQSPDGRLAIVVPEALAGEIAPGDRVELGNTSAEVTSLSARPLDPAEIERRTALKVGTPSVIVATSAAGNTPDPGLGRVRVGTDPVIVALIPGLGSLFGAADG